MTTSHSNGANRLPGIDALRFCGAVLVLGLHVGDFSQWPDEWMQMSRAAGRWVVPFFFLVMGFFIGLQPSGNLEATALKSARRMLNIMFVSTVIFLLLRLAMNGPRQTLLALISPEFFVRGIWGHLWFLHAALAGLLFLTLRPRISDRSALVSSAVLVACSVVDSLVATHKLTWEALFACRIPAGVCLLLLGVWMAQKPNLRLPHAVLVALGGGVLALIAQGFLVRRLGGEPAELQLQLGAIVIAIALLHIGLRLPTRPALETLADWGRRYALGLYLLHPLFIELLKKAGVLRSDVLWLGAATFSLLALIAAERFLPSAKAKLEGQ